MNKNLIFNPSGDDYRKTIIKGNSTGLFNLNNTKYNWAKSLYSVMVGNFWLPEKVKGLGEDSIQYNQLTEEEKRSVKGILSFLIFLDSIQTVNLPNFSNYITAPEVNLILAIQTFQEGIHSQSYATLLESVIPSEEREDIYYFWKDNPILLERNKYIGNIYQEFADNPTDGNFFKGIVANFILESIYFYNGFAFFDSLAIQGKLVACDRMISYVRKDELTHVTIFANLIKEIKKEFPNIYKEEIIIELLKEAVEQEIKWGQFIINNSVIGMSNSNIEQYTKYLADNRLGLLGINPIYNIKDNPFKHLDKLQDSNGDKANFFESTVSNYTQSSSLGSWDF